MPQVLGTPLPICAIFQVSEITEFEPFEDGVDRVKGDFEEVGDRFC
jgi:hypothetical protein